MLLVEDADDAGLLVASGSRTVASASTRAAVAIAHVALTSSRNLVSFREQLLLVLVPPVPRGSDQLVETCSTSSATPS